ncbi:hypothetical protein L1049_010985 [Liquidambar formosana]|uniref:Uncharacterized protein n=1 Tax=Liquidambar formosana TaxID=63359 RepID=A0AAP0RQW0_LIQFO
MYIFLSAYFLLTLIFPHTSLSVVNTHPTLPSLYLTLRHTTGEPLAHQIDGSKYLKAANNNRLERQDLNESTLDLSLGLKAHDGDPDSDSKTDQTKDGQLERVNSSSVGT